VSHNIEWRAVLSLVEFVGTAEEVHEGRFRITLGPESEIFERPKTKDISTQQVVDLRRMLKNAGYDATPRCELEGAVEEPMSDESAAV
jgi:hypothetical protein